MDADPNKKAQTAKWRRESRRRNFLFTTEGHTAVERLITSLTKDPNCVGWGGHGPEDHGNHGLHEQTGIRVGRTHFTIRQSILDPEY